MSLEVVRSTLFEQVCFRHAWNLAYAWDLCLFVHISRYLVCSELPLEAPHDRFPPSQVRMRVLAFHNFFMSGSLDLLGSICWGTTPGLYPVHFDMY